MPKIDPHTAAALAEATKAKRQDVIEGRMVPKLIRVPDRGGHVYSVRQINVARKQRGTSAQAHDEG